MAGTPVQCVRRETICLQRTDVGSRKGFFPVESVAAAEGVGLGCEDPRVQWQIAAVVEQEVGKRTAGTFEKLILVAFSNYKLVQKRPIPGNEVERSVRLVVQLQPRSAMPVAQSVTFETMPRIVRFTCTAFWAVGIRVGLWQRYLRVSDRKKLCMRSSRCGGTSETFRTPAKPPPGTRQWRLSACSIRHPYSRHTGS